MTNPGSNFTPPFCPRPRCPYHQNPTGWRFKKAGFFLRKARPHLIQRFLCLHCHRSFSSQTFHTTYWLKRPDIHSTLFLRILSCSAFRQIARQLDVAPSTVQHQIERLGRHCLLFQELHRPKYHPLEPLVVDGFETFEFSQYFPTHFHLAVGADSHFFYAFTDSELRRKGRMTPAQKRRRQELEDSLGRADPKSIVREMTELIRLTVRGLSCVTVHSDEHPAYPRAFRKLQDMEILHRVISSKRPRTPANPLFPVNLLDLLIRHTGANHKRETIAFSKRRQSGAERLAILQVWRNFMKPLSERRQNATPAQRLGLMERKLRVEDLLEKRLFPSLVRLPDRLARYYRREVVTRCIPNGRRHTLRYAF